jgi:ubiquinone/menaquinone biosynthesis C-methylase UbiE
LPRPHFGGGLSEPARQLYSANLEDKTVVNVEISGLLLKVAKKIELILKSPNNVGKSLKEIWEIEEAKYVNQQRPIIKPGGLSGLLDTEAEKKFWAQCAPLMHVFLKSWDHQQMAKMCLNSLHLESGNVIGDFASGVGNFMAQAIPFIVTDRKLNNVQLHGVDFTPAMIEEARKNPLFAEYGVKLHLADLCGQLPFEDNFFDGIAMVLGFGYLANPDQALTNMLRVLKPGGLATFITTVPKFNSFALFWRNVWRSSLFKVLKDIPMGWRYVKYMRAINRKLQEGVYRGYWNETLAEAISQAGFTDVIPLGLNSGSGRYFSGVTARKPISTTPA